MAPIHSAARRGNLNRVKALLNQGVPVNSRNEGGYTPLHFATYSGPVRVNVAQELLRRGAHVPPNLNAQVRLMLGLPLRRVRPRTGIPAYNNFNINHITVAPRAPTHTPRAVNAPNYSKTVKSVAKKFLMGPSRNVFLNKNGKPRNGNGPVNLNFNRGNYGIQYTRRWMSNGTNKSVRFYYTVPTFERLVGAKWSSIRHKAPTHVVFNRIPHLPPPKKDERQTAVYRRNLALVKFI